MVGAKISDRKGLMSTPLIDDREGFGFSVTRFMGPKPIGPCYQVNVQEKSIVLTAGQINRLFSELLRIEHLEPLAAWISDHLEAGPYVSSDVFVVVKTLIREWAEVRKV